MGPGLTPHMFDVRPWFLKTDQKIFVTTPLITLIL